jgi:acyl-CoA thioesterase-1
MRSLLFAVFALCVAAHAADPKRLVIIGDSLTEGYGVAHDAAYPALLEKEIAKSGKQWRVVNAGISGSTSASAVSQVQWHLKQKPDLMLIALGANDGLRGNSVAAMEKNIDKAIAEAKKGGVKVILAGMRVPPNYGKKYSDDFASVFPRLAKKHDVPLIPFLLEKVGGRPELNLSDGIHPNEKGHALIAKMVYEDIKKYL